MQHRHECHHKPPKEENRLVFKVKNQRLVRIDTTRIAAGSENLIECSFQFDSRWHNVDKQALFINVKGEKYAEPLGMNTLCECVVPEDVLYGNYFLVSVISDELSTNQESILIFPSGTGRISQQISSSRLFIDYNIDEDSDNPVANRSIALKFIEISEQINGLKTNLLALIEELQLHDSTSINDLKTSISEIEDALSGKLDKQRGKDLSTNDFSDEYLDKLSKIEDEANKTIVDGSLDETSENPISNKAVVNAINSKADKIHEHLSKDVTDFSDTTDVELGSMLDLLAESIRRI